MFYTHDQIKKEVVSIINDYGNCNFKIKQSDLTRLDNTILTYKNIEVRILLINTTETNVKSVLGFKCIDLIVSTFYGNTLVEEYTVHRFYIIDKNYYTTELCELYRINNIRYKRYRDKYELTHTTSYLKYNKLKQRTKDYINRLIGKYLTNLDRTLDFKIIDLYYRYVNCKRILVVVIKHNDCNYTEAITF